MSDSPATRVVSVLLTVSEDVAVDLYMLDGTHIAHILWGDAWQLGLDEYRKQIN